MSSQTPERASSGHRKAAAAFATAVLCLPACYPDFDFSPLGDGGAGGEGGSGAASATGAGGDPTTTTTATTASVGGGTSSGSTGGSGGEPPTGPIVPCTETPNKLCAEDQVCCFHKLDANCDKCGAKGQCTGSGSCTTDYIEFSCNTHADCPKGFSCCLELNGAGTEYVNIQCKGSCNATEFAMCEGPGDPACNCEQMTAAGTPYPGYYRCK